MKCPFELPVRKEQDVNTHRWDIWAANDVLLLTDVETKSEVEYIAAALNGYGKLRGALARYGNHTFICAKRGRGICNCGFDQALKEAEQ